MSAQVVTEREIDSSTESVKRMLRARDAAKPAYEVLDSLAAWLKQEIEPLTVWANQQAAENVKEFDFAFSLNLLPWLVLDATERQRTLQAARDIDSLLDASQKRSMRARTLRQGAEQLLSKLNAPAVRKALAGAVAEDDDDDFVVEDGEDLLELMESFEAGPASTPARTPQGAATVRASEPPFSVAPENYAAKCSPANRDPVRCRCKARPYRSS